MKKMAKICVGCENKIGALSSGYKLGDGDYACKNCFKLAGYGGSFADLKELKTMTSAEFKKRLPADAGEVNAKDLHKSQLAQFKAHANLTINDVLFNDQEQALLIKKSIMFNRPQSLIKYEDIDSYTPIFDSGKMRKGSFSRGVVGGAVAGPLGSLVASSTGKKSIESISRLGIDFHLKDGREIQFLLAETDVKLDSITGRALVDDYNKLVEKLDSLFAPETSASSAEILSPVDEIRKYKELLDEGILTQAEFDAKKKELLEN
ncbi:hypothetical protein RV00_GL002602 [Enterococcus devriesei]|uniref:SHOCT domain-containing protein n=2 Tax=Enterococcus devriesei TaxID=319970 RepID=A0A1L8STH0_9ENTE|nr:hypothetical protein RV00_GL002602 [Enterococcus devriesei]